MSITRRHLLQLTTALPFATSALSLLSRPAFAAAKIQRVLSPGGIEAWLVQDATVPLVALEYAFDGGSSQDPADKPGTGSFTANMLDEGAADLDSKAFHERLERRAIEMTFSVTRDYLRGSMRMLKENRDEGFGLLKLALTSARFDSEPLERVRSQMVSNARRETTNPVSIAGRKFWEQAFGTHPYARAPNGTVESLPAIQAADLKDYAGRVLAKDTLKVAVVGDIDADALGKLLDTAFGALPAKANLTPVPDATFGKLPQQSFTALDVPQTSINFGAPALKRSDPDFMAAYIVNHILGGGTLSTRLYKEVREKRGLVYSVSENLIWMKHSSIFAGSTATRADKATETLDTISAEIARMGSEGPTQKELDEAKSYLKGSQMLALDTSPKFATALLQYQIDNLGIDYIERRNAIVDAVTLDDARRVAKRIWGQGLLSVSVGRAVQASAQPATGSAPKAN
ncbi:pitrilysin family protein [Bradyrhizobium sp. G127]|uniref:M16 family metallopeptidase n=1 Tax=Bradyrhizobium sp. G127 TaxID=2904800 RepID=UPI001F394942|nr:insulinase family protein [Bradyrhizobium sp. G127]